jgi:hypothetical protein
MPKRAFGVCPVCGRYLIKRGGKLRTHWSAETRPELCSGSGKRVPTLKQGKL